MSRASEPLILYSVGHSNQTAAEFVAMLQHHNIGLLVDVRSAPYSRWVPHFNKNALEALLPEHNIEYRFAGKHLGGRPTDETLYKEPTTPADDTKREAYLKKVDYQRVSESEHFRVGLRHLLKLVAEQGSNVAMMCAEAMPYDCHRHHLITRSLIDPKWRFVEEVVQVQHILGDGTIEDAKLDQFTEPPQQLGLFE